MPLAQVSCPVTGLFEQIRIERFNRFRFCEIVLPWRAVAAAREPGQDCGSANPADGVANESIGKTGSLCGQMVDIGRLNKGMAVAAQRRRGLIIGEEEHDVGAVGAQSIPQGCAHKGKSSQ